MKVHELEHLIRAASTIADDDELFVVGSQAILATFPRAPEALLVSVEADIYPKNFPERWELIDGSLGELSPFHETFGYDAQGIEPGTAILPHGWEARVVVLEGPGTRGARGLCLEVHDLLLSKYVAAREKDRRYCAVAVAAGLCDPALLEARVPDLPIDDEHEERVVDAIRRDASGASHG